MTKEILIFQIEEEIARLEKIEYDNSTIDFAFKYFKDNPYSNYESLSKLDVVGACILYFWFNSRIDEGLVQDALIKMASIFKRMPQDKYHDFVLDSMALVMDNEDIMDCVDLDFKSEDENNYYLSALDYKIESLLHSVDIDDVSPTKCYNFLVCLYQLIGFKDIQIDCVQEEFGENVKIIKKNTDLVADAVMFARMMADYKNLYNKYIEVAEERTTKYFGSGNISKETRKKLASTNEKVFKDVLSKASYTKKIKKFLDDINSQSQELSKRMTSMIKQRNRTVNNYNGLMSELNGLDEDSECMTYETLISKAKDEKIKRSVLEYVYGINMHYYEKLESSYLAVEQVYRQDYAHIFAKYGLIVPFSYLQMLTITPQEVDESLTSLRKMQITDSELILEILSKATPDSISHLENLYERRIIDSSFLTTYPMVFDAKSMAYTNVFKNVNVFISAGLNPLYLSSSPKTLLGDSITIKDSIEYLKSKDLLSTIDRNTDVSFLTNEDLAKITEKIADLGYTKDLKEDINLLNIPTKRWNRVALLNAIGQIVDSESLLEVLTCSTFIVPDIKLPEYLEALNCTSKENGEHVSAKIMSNS